MKEMEEALYENISDLPGLTPHSSNLLELNSRNSDIPRLNINSSDLPGLNPISSDLPGLASHSRSTIVEEEEQDEDVKSQAKVPRQMNSNT